MKNTCLTLFFAFASALTGATASNDLSPTIFAGRGDSAIISLTQDQKTVICPIATQDLYEGHVHFGPRTRFVLKNTASEPVFVTFVERNGTEISAANPHISPAHLDPDAILAPGVAKVFAVHEGHIFHVRDVKTGELLLQHRAGLVPIENRYNREISSCPPFALDNHNQGLRVMRKFPEWNPTEIERYQEQIQFDIGLRNSVKAQDGSICPVNLFFVYKEEFGNKRPPQYMEQLSLQFGSNLLATARGDAGDASAKYEHTSLGHQFVARLAHDETVVVDHVSIAPIHVQDCIRKKKTATVKSMASSIVIPVGRYSKLGDLNNNETSWEDIFDHLNTTEGRRGMYFKMYSE